MFYLVVNCCHCKLEADTLFHSQYSKVLTPPKGCSSASLVEGCRDYFEESSTHKQMLFISENGVLANCVPESQALETTNFLAKKVKIGMFEAHYLGNY